MSHPYRWIVAVALLAGTAGACFVPLPPPPWRGRELREERVERRDHDHRYERRERWREDRRERWD
jgi:hypothetical protein